MEKSAKRLLFAMALTTLPMLGLHGSVSQARTAELQQHTCIFDQQMLRTKTGTCRPHAVAYPKGVRDRVHKAIYDSALIFGVPYGVLLKIARCESSLNPHATDGVHFGLFQFLPDTFHRGARLMKRSTGITAGNLWNPHDASYVAGYLFAIGQAPSWSCE